MLDDISSNKLNSRRFNYIFDIFFFTCISQFIKYNNFTFRKFFIDLDNHYCKHPYTEEPQNWDSFQAGEYAGLGNTFRLAEDEGFQIQNTDEGGYYKWHFDTKDAFTHNPFLDFSHNNPQTHRVYIETNFFS